MPKPSTVAKKAVAFDLSKTISCFILLPVSTNVQLELRVFAVPSLTFAGQVLRFPSRKGLALLILLALEGEQSREKLANWLWLDSPNPRDALRNALAQVNKVLSSAGLMPLAATRQTVSWHEPTLWVDALQLEQHPSEALLRAMRGAWLEGFMLEGAPEFDSWATERGAFYTGLLQQQLEHAIEIAVQSARVSDALLLAQQRLRLDALNESAYQQLMRVQRLAGREAEARETLLLCRTTLQRELGVTPSAKTLGVLNETLTVIQIPNEETPIGRVIERAWLEDIRAQKAFGLLLGEAGAGKTALLRSVLTQAIWIECRPNDAALPFSSVSRGLRKRLRDQPELAAGLPEWARLELARFLPELHHHQPTESLDRLRLYAALSLIFPNSSALIVDDLHFMDEMSAAWLWQVAQQRLDDASALTVLAYRPNDITNDTQVALTQLERLGAKSQRILPLSATDLAVWLQRLQIAPHLAEEFLGLTAGNALFFKEAALAYLSSGNLEQGLMPLLQQRLQALSPLEWQLTQFVAVANSQATLALATQVLQTDQLQIAQTWARLEQTDVLRGSRFAHDLLRDAALQLTPSAIQIALASGLLEALEQRLHRQELVPVAILADLAFRANDLQREANYRLQAALETYRMGFISNGIVHFERCIHLLEAQSLLFSAEQLESLYFDLLPIYRANFYTSSSMHPSLEQLLSISRVRGLRHLEAVVLANQADVLSKNQQLVAATTLFNSALELAKHHKRAQATIFELRAWAENSTNQTLLALENAKQTLILAQELADSHLEFRALEAMYMFEQNLSLWFEAGQHAIQAAEVALSTDHHFRMHRPYALTMAAFCALQIGNLPSAEQQIRLALDLLENSDWHNGLGFAKRTFALVLLERDDLSQALEAALESIGHNQQIQNDFAIYSGLSCVARIHIAANRPSEALVCLEQAEEVLAKISGLHIANVAQSFLDSLRCAAKTQLNEDALHNALRAVQTRENAPNTSSWLLLAPREYEIAALWKGGQEALAKRELEKFMALHPDNPRVQILHARAKAAVLSLENQVTAAGQIRQEAIAKAVELGFVMQAKVLQNQR